MNSNSMNSKKKKKKGQSKAQQQQQEKADNKKGKVAEKQNLPEQRQADSDDSRDSDSCPSDDDSYFAKRMASIQGGGGRDVGAHQKAAGKTSKQAAAQAGSSKSNSGASSKSNSGTSVLDNGFGGPSKLSSQHASSSATSKAGSWAESSMGLDDFSLGKSAAVKKAKSTKSTVNWPFDNYEFRIVCRLCFVKEREGIGGYTYKPNHPHNCSHDILIIRNSPHLSWLKIRPRITMEGNTNIYQYKLCINFQQGQPCRVGEPNCSYAHSPAEINFWNLDRDGDFNISRFIAQAKQCNIFSSNAPEMKAATSQAAHRYIPGMPATRQFADTSIEGSLNSSQGMTRNTSVPPPQLSQPPPNVKQWSPPNQQVGVGGLFPQQQSYAHFNTSTGIPETRSVPFNGPFNPQATRNASEPSYPTANHKTEVSPPLWQPNPGQQRPQHQQAASGGYQTNSAGPQFEQTAPQVSNPLPQLDWRLLCPACMEYTQRPWLYVRNLSLQHDCELSILAYLLPNKRFWVQVRERASHRSFSGNYIMCRSVVSGDPNLCAFKASCTFAHNEIEQHLWKLEQVGQFDIGEFFAQAKLRALASTRGFSPSRSAAQTAQSSSGMYVQELLDKFGGYFRFICRPCFFARVPMISGTDASKQTCIGQGRHHWMTSRIVAHVKDTAFTPIDERKLVHEGAFFLMCNYQQFCMNWYANKCRYAHSQVEKAVWMLERDTKITRDELVQQSAGLFTAKLTQNAPPPKPAQTASQNFWAHAPHSQAQAPQGQGQGQAQAKASQPQVSRPAVMIKEYCRTCWGKGQKSEEDKDKDRCVRGHSNFKLNSAFVALPGLKEIRSLPGQLFVGMKLILCEYYPKCTRRVCTHPHGREELEVWGWMLRSNVRTLREVCDRCTEAQQQQARQPEAKSAGGATAAKGAGTAVQQSTAPAPKAVNQIFAPGDLHIHEHYCQYCGTSCNSERQWDEHCMSERHISNVNSDKDHQWNFRQPPWGQGKNIALCAKHLHNKSCQYSYVPDMYNLCRHAHSQEELDEWLERLEWRQMKRAHAFDRSMSSYTEALLEVYHKQGKGSSVITENLPEVQVTCKEDQVLYRTEKNDIFTWTFEIQTKKTLAKVALLYNKDRLHFKLLSSTGAHHQVASGETFLGVDSRGKPCYKVKVHFTGGMFGSFSQWVVFDFGSHPVLVKKLSVEIGDQIQHERVKELREELAMDRWTNLNREIVSFASEAHMSGFDLQLLNNYKEPSASEDVVTSHRLTELNTHNYTHKMHGLLELEEITRHAIITSYNLCCEVTFSQTLQETGMFLIGINGDLFIKVNLTENLTNDTLAGKLVLSSVRTALLARADSTSNKVYEASLVGEHNYGFDGRGKEYVYLVIQAETASALCVGPGQTVKLELQFQMDRLFFCRMHYALDSLANTDVVFPDLVKFKPDINRLSSATKAKLEDLNEDQMLAVRHIVVPREGYTPPFIMYGPFGTGKTRTLAQATLALLRERREQCRILICTQSNSAADLYITKYLHSFLKKGGRHLKVLRLNSDQRRLNTVPEVVQEFCNAQGSGDRFSIPPKEEIEACQLVLTTVETSLILSSMGLHGHFTHIFVDEAGQTLECEILMPLSLATTKTCVVLAGDHHQIGPTVYSQEARRQNFDLSMLVRLFNYYDMMANCLGQVSDNTKKSPVNIFLSINYRTKEEILRFISSVFYGGPDSLKSEGKIPAVIGITPLMFFAVQGREIQNTDSTSYLNHAEAQEVVAQVTELLDNWPYQWGHRDPSQVAVIATYSDQVRHIRKLLRGDKRRPYLGQVDVGPIHSFQGKEVRALFITAVRTSNLLREPHIIRSLEAGEDIGELGFMSDPKLLNTALTRTQSFVAVVGDPVALCLIGECTQIWRTYLKHCSNMGSVRPMSYNYEAIKTKALQSYQGPDGRVIEMIAKRGQDSYKQQLNSNRKAASGTTQEEKIAEVLGQLKVGEDDGQSYGQGREPGTSLVYAGGDATELELILDEELREEGGGRGAEFMRNSGDGGSLQTSQLETNASGHQAGTQQQAELEIKEVSANLAVSTEDILFQLARESVGEAGNTSVDVRSEGISITVEKQSLAVLTYGQVGQEPFKLMSEEEEDFITFTVPDEDSGVSDTYENWGKDKLWTSLESDPLKFFKCVLAVKTRDFAVATVQGQLDAAASTAMNGGHMVGQDIEIEGGLTRGHALDGDTVVVEILAMVDNAWKGQVKGILDRSLDPIGRLFVCEADPDSTGILTPLNRGMPRIYAVTSAMHATLARKGYVCVYKLGSRSCIEFSSYERVDALGSSGKRRQLFIVRYLCWQPGFLLPCGVVVGVMPEDDSLDLGRKMIDIEHNIQPALRPVAKQEAEIIFPASSEIPADLLAGRHNLTADFCFTINDDQTGGLELAVSVVQTENMYEVGLHISDISAFVDKDSVLDQECELRGASMFPLAGQSVALHMLPCAAATDQCSLRPGFNRLAVSVVINVDEEGKPCGEPAVFRSVVNSKRNFTHAEVEDILLTPEEAETDYLKSCIIVLYQLAFLWRGERLGNGQFYSGLGPEHKLSQHSHLMMEEVRLQFDNLVANLLLARFPETTPLLVQPPPPKDKLAQWKQENASVAMHSIPMTRAFLEEKVCRCSRACACVFSYIRQQRLEVVDYLAMLKESWLAIRQAVSEEEQDFESAHEVIASPEHIPQVWLTSRSLAKLQPRQSYACSAHIRSLRDRQHYELCLGACVAWTSPARTYMGLVLQRMLGAFIDGAGSPYNAAEMADICAAATVTERQVEHYHHDYFLLHMGLTLKMQPVMLTAVVNEVSVDSLTVSMGPGLKDLPDCSIDLRLLGAARISSQSAGGGISLEWSERVYDLAVSERQAQYSTPVKLEPDRLTCNIQGMLWQRLLIAVREKDDASLASYVAEISRQVGGDLELRSTKSQEVEILSDRERHFVPFSLNLSQAQCLSVEVVALPHGQGGLQSLNPELGVQLLQLTPCLSLCLEHRRLPHACFTSAPSPASTGGNSFHQVTFSDEGEYTRDWLLPALAQESAQQAVEAGERVTIHSVSIAWSSASPVGLTGEFVLNGEFCERSCFCPDTGMTLASTLLDRALLYSEDSNFALDYLCIRYPHLGTPLDTTSLASQQKQIPDSVMAVLHSSSEAPTWVCHCRVTAVSRSLSGDYQVKVSLVQSNMEIPAQLVGGRAASALCTVEWIGMTWQHRVMDIAARSLAQASAFVKDVSTGRKPMNTIDPVPQDNSVLAQAPPVSPEQQEIMSECYRQPFLATVGGPGTGKSVVTARLAHLIVARNRTTDAFRQVHASGGLPSQLMICAPTERSLDVVTGFLLAFNFTNVNIVRVYSEDVEERDFPTLNAKLRLSKGMQPSCAVMEDLALHHLIRRGESAEVKELLEAEMLLTMYYGDQANATLAACVKRAQQSVLRAAHVILCTPLNSARPILPSDTNIRQIILDDAGLIPECESLVPLALHNNVNQLLVFGDPKMPSKELRSDTASQLGLARSLVHRYAESAKTLSCQFRTTQALARFPCVCFYQEALTTHPLNPNLRTPAATIPWPGQPGLPFLFCHVLGRERRRDQVDEGLSASDTSCQLVNVQEVQVVAALVEALVSRHRVEESAILVLTATPGQAAMMRESISRSVDVCPVRESFGRECEYVIVSTVRSLPSATLERPASASWTRKHLGHMADPGTVNLAITRARTALFIVGNKDLLSMCEVWQSLLVMYRHYGCLQTNARLFLQTMTTD